MRTLIAIAACIGVPALGLAQTVGSPPDSRVPSAPDYRVPTVPKQSDYTLPPLPSVPDESAPVARGGQMFVSRVEVRAVTVFKPAVIAAILAPYQNRVVTGVELQTLRVALTRLYIDKGYIGSGIILPDQQSKDGVVVFQAIEGKLAGVQVVGKTKLSSRYVASRIRSHVQDPLNLMDLRYALRYLQQDPNVERLDARLAPGAGPGLSILRLDVEDQPRFSAGLDADNYESSSIGANEGKAFFGARNLSGYGDELKASIGRSRGNTLGSASFSIPVNAHNASFQAYYSRGAAVIIEQPFEALNIKETVRTYGLSLTVPLLDRLDNRLSFFIGGESNRSFTELLGSGFSFSPGAQNGISEVTALLGGFDWLARGSSSVTDLRLTYRRGIDALGATINTPSANAALFNPNSTGADGRFGLEQLQFIHIERLNGLPLLAGLNDRAQLLVRASGQLTQNPLLALEKFTLGGIDTVRGVPENLFVRDNGAAATLELQLPIPGFRPQANPRDLVIAPFLDYGRSWDRVNSERGNLLADTSTARYIASAGLGLLWNPFRGLDAQVYWGRAIANNLGADDPRRALPHDLQFHGIYFAVSFVVHW